MLRKVLALIAACGLALTLAGQAPAANKTMFAGGYQAAYLCNYLNGAFCGGESYSTTSLRTVVDATGVMTYAPNNLLTYSNTFSNAAWSTIGITKTSNAATAPDGTLTASSIIETASTNYRLVYQSVLSINTNYLIPFYAQAVGSETRILISDLSSGAKFATFTLTGAGSAAISGVNANVLLTAATIQSVGSGWYLCSVVYSNTTTAINPAFYIRQTTTFAGDGVSGFNLWHATASAVTYETSPSQRPAGDQTITTSAAYYGPALPDHNPATLASLGYRSEAAATNLYLNSGAPATQTITVANATQYTGSIRQTGTQAFTGAFTATLTGAANTTTQTTQTSATTSLVATDTGLAATAYPQVEAGAFATSPIITGASATTRAGDSVTLTGLLAALKVTNPIIVERQSEATGAISRTLYAANTFSFATGYWYRKVAAYPIGTPAAVLSQIAAMQRPM